MDTPASCFPTPCPPSPYPPTTCNRHPRRALRDGDATCHAEDHWSGHCATWCTGSRGGAAAAGRPAAFAGGSADPRAGARRHPGVPKRVGPGPLVACPPAFRPGLKPRWLSSAVLCAWSSSHPPPPTHKQDPGKLWALMSPLPAPSTLGSLPPHPNSPTPPPTRPHMRRTRATWARCAALRWRWDGRRRCCCLAAATLSMTRWVRAGTCYGGKVHGIV